MEILNLLLNNFWLYGGSYFGSLAAASSFYAIFFFFWTRTGDRKNKIDIETKKIYLMPIYWILRFSLLMIILFKALELLLVQQQLRSSDNIDRSIFDIATSENLLFIIVLLVILATNSAFMYFKKINYSYAIPIAVTSYFFLFLASTKLMYSQVTAGYTEKAGMDTVIYVITYLLVLVVCFFVFGYFNKKIRS